MNLKGEFLKGGGDQRDVTWNGVPVPSKSSGEQDHPYHLQLYLRLKNLGAPAIATRCVSDQKPGTKIQGIIPEGIHNTTGQEKRRRGAHSLHSSLNYLQQTRSLYCQDPPTIIRFQTTIQYRVAKFSYIFVSLSLPFICHKIRSIPIRCHSDVIIVNACSSISEAEIVTSNYIQVIY